jgi:hypothetical protein
MEIWKERIKRKKVWNMYGEDHIFYLMLNYEINSEILRIIFTEVTYSVISVP